MKDSLNLYINIKDDYLTLEKPEETNDLNEIVKGKWEYKSKEQEGAIKDIKTLYKSREKNYSIV